VKFNKNLEVKASYDVIVAGGGPAGLAAAIASAREGLSTLLIEREGNLGGHSISGAYPFWLGCISGSRPFLKMLDAGETYRDTLMRGEYVVKGIFKEIVDDLKQECRAIGPGVMAQSPALERLGAHDDIAFDLEAGKRVFEKKVLEAGADISYFTTALEPEIKHNVVKGLFVVNKSGINYIETQAIIDCTGDADVIHRGGYETQKGDEETGLMNAMSLVAQVENVNINPLINYLQEGGDPWFREFIQLAQKKCKEDEVSFNDNIIMFPMIQEGVFLINGGMIFPMKDGTNPEDRTKVMIKGRQRAKKLLEEILRPYVPGFRNARLRLTAPVPGVRETRKIIGEHIIQEEEVLAGKEYNDTIAYSGRHFDLGRPYKKPDGTIGMKQPFHEENRSIEGSKTAVPYRSLIPKDSVNIVTAGRCLAAQGQSLGPLRIMPTCFATGQAAGTAAALVIRNNISFKEVDVHKLRQKLTDAGAIV